METLAFVDNRGTADSVWAKTTIVPLPLRNEPSTPNRAGGPTGRVPLDKESLRYLSLHSNPSRVSSHESVVTEGATMSSTSTRAHYMSRPGAPGALKLPINVVRAKIASGVRPAAESTPFPGRRLDFGTGPPLVQDPGMRFAPHFLSASALAPPALLTAAPAAARARIRTEQLAYVMTQKPSRWPETSWDHPSAYLRGFDHYSARRVTAMPPDSTVVIHVWGYPDEAAPPCDYVEAWLRATIGAFIKYDNGFALIPPEPHTVKNIAPNALNVPVAWIATGLPDDAAMQLRNQFAISTARITFTCSENSPRAPLVTSDVWAGSKTARARRSKTRLAPTCAQNG